jgi:Flp pilus assembly protein TadB
MSPDDPRGAADGDARSDRQGPPGSFPGPHGRRPHVQVFEARSDGAGEWRLDDSPARGGWAYRVKQFLLVSVSLAVAAALWVFAFALMLVLLPLVALAGWWMWRRLKSMQRAHIERMARARGTDPL